MNRHEYPRLFILSLFLLLMFNHSTLAFLKPAVGITTSPPRASSTIPTTTTTTSASLPPTPSTPSISNSSKMSSTTTISSLSVITTAENTQETRNSTEIPATGGNSSTSEASASSESTPVPEKFLEISTLPEYLFNNHSEKIVIASDVLSSNSTITETLGQIVDPEDQQREVTCPPTLAEGNRQWRRGSQLITAYLPHMEPTTCKPPMKCQMSTTVHRVIYLQDGDSLQIILQHFPTASKPSPTNDTTIEIPPVVAEEEEEKEKVGTVRGKFNVSFLTIWKVIEPEWVTCSTREGGKVTESRQDGVVIIDDSFLLPGIQFFIGRSSWSSSECFKLKVIVRPVNCGDGSICSGKGICFSNTSMSDFSCDCCDRYKGKHCEEKDACSSSPCHNSGMCYDISEGHDGDTFECLCHFGFQGPTCDTPTNLCNSNPCRNEGSCEGNHTNYSCHCRQGWTGLVCEEESSYDFENDKDDDFNPIYDDASDFDSTVDGCSGIPCVHGVCVETTAKDINCFCQPGFGGKRCDFEYDECCSGPCQNEGTCVDHVGEFKCHCGQGYAGPTCLDKINLCESNPCPLNRNCVDKGNFYTCDCFDDDFVSADCDNYEEVCNPNPCNHGGSCYTIAETSGFYCACRPGFTGQTCQDNSILESVVPVDSSMTFDNSNSNDDDDDDEGQQQQKELSNNPLSHLKNMYTGLLTLACAFLIFLLVLSVCHCMVKHENNCRLNLLRLLVRLLPSFLFRRGSDGGAVVVDKRSRSEECTSLRLDSDSEGNSSMPMPSSNTTAASIFYNMDVCDNQPLIK